MSTVADEERGNPVVSFSPPASRHGASAHGEQVGNMGDRAVADFVGNVSSHTSMMALDLSPFILCR